MLSRDFSIFQNPPRPLFDGNVGECFGICTLNTEYCMAPGCWNSWLYAFCSIMHAYLASGLTASWLKFANSKLLNQVYCIKIMAAAIASSPECSFHQNAPDPGGQRHGLPSGLMEGELDFAKALESSWHKTKVEKTSAIPRPPILWSNEAAGQWPRHAEQITCLLAVGKKGCPENCQH